MALGDDKARDVVGKLIAAQATVFAECSMTPVSRQAAREGAMEAFPHWPLFSWTDFARPFGIS